MRAFQLYWKVYGGVTQIFLSPYFLGAGLLWAFLAPFWRNVEDGRFPWLEYSISIVPSMLGFSIGAIAILMAFSNEKFLKLIRQNGSEDSYLINVFVAFFHFILVQFFTIAITLVALTYQIVFFSSLAFFSFSYALACGIAASAVLLELAEILNQMGINDESDDDT